MAAKPRVLLFAYACDPRRGSEPGAGATVAGVVSEIAESVVVITRIEADLPPEELQKQLGSNVRVITTGPRTGGMPTYLRYFLWILAASKVARKLRSESQFDVLHHATYATDWFVNPFVFLRKLATEVWVWGPAGGASYAPAAVSRIVLESAALSERVRTWSTNSIRAVVHRLLRAKVDTAIALNLDSERSFVRGKFAKVLTHSNAVLDYENLPVRGVPDERVLVYAGRGVSWKGLTIAIKAMAFLPDWKLKIAGPGTNSDSYRAMAREIGDRIEFLGALDRASTLSLFASATAMALPSLHDSAPWAAGEAAGIGTPVVCLDLGGVATMAGSMAVVVPTGSDGDLLQKFASAVRTTPHMDAAPDRSHTKLALAETFVNAYRRSPR
ncbi:glycosyltransferase family 4 protein [Herbiconiux sp. 11R-BC]|uniref:glycosyltransferase family 4 protein n=1 Tax=Herbiconiux sp. 11R-BC TaxID=3111637 RepID=UPI003C031EC1